MGEAIEVVLVAVVVVLVMAIPILAVIAGLRWVWKRRARHGLRIAVTRDANLVVGDVVILAGRTRRVLEVDPDNGMITVD